MGWWATNYTIGGLFQFEECVYGLGMVRRGWEQTDPAGFAAVNRMWLG